MVVVGCRSQRDFAYFKDLFLDISANSQNVWPQKVHTALNVFDKGLQTQFKEMPASKCLSIFHLDVLNQTIFNLNGTVFLIYLL